MNRVKSGVSSESENLYETNANLHDATVNGDSEESEGAFNRELCRRGFWRLAENILAQIAHDNDKANDYGENRLEELVTNVD